MMDVSDAGSIVFNYQTTRKATGNSRPSAISQRARDSIFQTLLDAFVEHTLVRRAPSCMADVIAEHGDITLEEVGMLMSITRERVRQVETKGMRNFVDNGVEMGVFKTQDIAEEFLARIRKK